METSKVRQVRTVISHDNCGDGTASALLLRDALPDATIQFVQYGTEAYRNLEASPGMLFCDICPPADRAEEFVRAGALVLDHHRTARAVVEQFGPNGVFADEALEPGVSGAMLAYREVWGPLKGTQADPKVQAWAEKFATLTGIRDTWQNKSPQWDEACRQGSLMHFMPNTDWMRISVSELAANWDTHFEWIGHVLTDRHAKGVQKSLGRSGHYRTERGTRVVIFNSTSHTSDAVESLGAEADLVAGFAYEVENGQERMIISTRSRNNFDCSAFAKMFGGGGHLRAAGFSVPVGEKSPYNTILELVRQFESK
jgi:oligoribonuclease NrnB/cAMP/cGMP phosphodiesterase (DHH superfamily)